MTRGRKDEGTPPAEDAPTEIPADRLTYRGRPIVRRTLNLGVGGSIDLPAELLVAPGRARIRLELEADLSSVKCKFDPPSGKTVSESTILTIVADTVAILDVADPPEEPEQGTLDEAAAGGEDDEPKDGDGE